MGVFYSPEKWSGDSALAGKTWQQVAAERAGGTQRTASNPATATAAPSNGAGAAPRPNNRGGTILTNPAGLTNDTVQRKTLLTA
ncbi:MAG: hypothetical protein GEU92_21290 [Alphaproteobacteria bacterium]|nr:hypothetical protein [Alphaproteobacteria bacterium]